MWSGGEFCIFLPFFVALDACPFL
uniref:Uncharacterized protein n=1 Tax=Anguilla anguilla TaxID=7936 RepID=A0A0E9SQV1_ANGAN